MGAGALGDVLVLDELLEVVGDVRTQVVATLRQLTNRQSVVADVVEDQRLHVVDVTRTDPFEFEFDDLQELPVQTLDQRHRVEVVLFQRHQRLTLAQNSQLRLTFSKLRENAGNRVIETRPRRQLCHPRPSAAAGVWR